MEDKEIDLRIYSLKLEQGHEELASGRGSTTQHFTRMMN
jgi:hypothetical protein